VVGVGDVPLQVDLGATEVRLGFPRRALHRLSQVPDALDQAHALGGETIAYWYFRALCLDHIKEYKQALPSYEKFLSLSQNKNPDEEFKARQRVRVIQKELSKR